MSLLGHLVEKANSNKCSIIDTVDSAAPLIDSPLPAGTPTAPRDDAALFVATNLVHFENERRLSNADLAIDGVCYRRLDPEYYAWLRTKMARARIAFEMGDLSEETFHRLHDAFNAIHDWAIEHFGEATLQRAFRWFKPRQYLPPTLDGVDAAAIQVVQGHLYPPDGNWRFVCPVSRQAIAKVDAIRDQALSAGWTEARLYQNRGRLRFPCGGDYGLVCFVHGKEQLGQTTPNIIEILGNKPAGYCLQFRNKNS